jgi:hypothetical protein
VYNVFELFTHVWDMYELYGFFVPFESTLYKADANERVRGNNEQSDTTSMSIR